MAATQADLGNVHLDIVGAVVMTAVGVERAPGVSFGGVQDVFQRGQCVVVPVRELSAAAPTALSPSVSTRTGISRFSIVIFSRMDRWRSTRYSAFLTSLPSGIGST